MLQVQKFAKKPNTQNMCSLEVHKSTMNENDSKEYSVKNSTVSDLSTTQDVQSEHEAESKQHRSMSSAGTPITREEIEKALCLPRIQSFLVQTRLHRIPVTKSRSSQRPRSTFVVEDRKVTCSLPNCPPIVGCSVPILNGRQMCASNPSNAVKEHSTTQ